MHNVMMPTEMYTSAESYGKNLSTGMPVCLPSLDRSFMASSSLDSWDRELVLSASVGCQ